MPVLTIVSIMLLVGVFNCEESEKLVKQLLEIKMSLLTVGSKVSTMESKIAEFQVLDYAFKVNNIETHLRQLETKMDSMHKLMVDMKDNLRTTCPNRNSEIERMSYKEMPNSDILEKIESHEQRSSQDHDEILLKINNHQQGLEGIRNLTRSGIIKLYDKINQVSSLEEHLTSVVNSNTDIAAYLAQLSERINMVTSDVKEVKSNVQRNGQRLGNVASNGNQRHAEAVTQAFRIAAETQSEVEKLEKLEGDVVQSTAMARKIETEFKSRYPDDVESRVFITMLAKKLNDLQTALRPVVFNTDYNINNIHALLRAVADNKTATSCSLQQKLSPTDLSAIENILKSGPKASTEEQESSVVGSIVNKLSDIQKGTVHNDVYSKLDHVRYSLTRIQEELRDATKNCGGNLPNGGSRLQRIVG